MDIKLLILIFVSSFVILFFIFVGIVYPIRMKKQIVSKFGEIQFPESEEYSFQIKLSAYLSNILFCLLFGVLAFSVYYFLKYPIDTIATRVFIVSIMLFWLLLTVFYILKVVIFLPRTYIIYKDDIIYYHNGLREVILEEINNVKFQDYYNSFFWYLIVTTDDLKNVNIEILSFHEPEIIYKILVSKIKIKQKLNYKNH